MPANLPVAHPFRENIVHEPRLIEPPVSGLNVHALNTLLGEFAELEQGPLPRLGARPGHAFLITSPQAGFGKSHLIGRLFQALEGRACPVYVRPFEDPASCWQSVLDRTLQALQLPDLTGSPEPSLLFEFTQLDAFAHGLIACLLADLLEKGVISNRRPEAMREALRQPLPQLLALTQKTRWQTGVRSLVGTPGFFPYLVQQLKTYGLPLHATPGSWLRILYTFAYFPTEIEIREACLGWLKGEALEESWRERIGLAHDLLRPEPSLGEANVLARNRLLDLCTLAGFSRPFVFCFDQTENYGKNPDLARALGALVQVLTDYGDHQMTLLTANLDPWMQRIRPYWEEAQLDRLRKPALQLAGLDKDQALELIRQRFARSHVPPQQAQDFCEDSRWLDQIFSEAQYMGVRNFLQTCHQHWQELDRLPLLLPTLPEYYGRYLEKLQVDPHRLVYDRDALYWLVDELARGLPEVMVDRYQTEDGRLMPCWHYRGQRILFGLESGSHWQRWQAILRQGAKYCREEPKSRLVYLRTPELNPIPGRWKTAPEIEAAKQRYLRVLVLDQGLLGEIYAAHDLYSDAQQGNIPFPLAAVHDYLRQRLQRCWVQLLEGTPPPDDRSREA